MYTSMMISANQHIYKSPNMAFNNMLFEYFFISEKKSCKNVNFNLLRLNRWYEHITPFLSNCPP